MDGSPLRRLLLLLLLPVVALALYYEGQRYDPALIRFSSDDLATGGQAALLPERVGAFLRSTTLRVFAKDNLYEYVNGHAEYFLANGFESLVVGDYLQEGSPSGQADLVADIYDMGRPLYASTILADAIGGAPSTLPFGAMGARTGQGISFVSGRYYVRIGVFRADVPAEKLAAAIHALIAPAPVIGVVNAEARLPDLPGAGPVHFVKEGYRGLDFANNIQEREYTIAGSTAQVALAAGSPAEVERLLATYLAFFAASEVAMETLHVNGQSIRKIIDLYEGDWYLIERPGALFGIYGVKDMNTLEALLAALWPGDEATGVAAP